MKEKFTAEELAVYKRLLEKFSGTIVKNEHEAICLCPAHDNTDPSLGVDIRKNGKGPKILLKCRSAGCSYPDILKAGGLSPSDLHFASTNGQKKALPLEGCYLDQYAEAKGLPVEFLTSDGVGLSQATYYDRYYGVEVPAIYTPYADEDGDVVAERFRVGLNKASKGQPDSRFRWAHGDQPTLYGLHRLQEAQEAGYVFLVEGESDAQTAWYHEEPVLGVPGASNWKDEWAPHLAGIGEIFVLVEPDGGGSTFWKKVSGCSDLSGRVKKAVLP